jgi:hypothetical protein
MTFIADLDGVLRLITYTMAQGSNAYLACDIEGNEKYKKFF